MTDTYKVLGQALTGELANDNSTIKESVVYTVPSAAQASLSAITITNSDAAAQSYSLSFVPSQDVSAATAYVQYTTPVVKNNLYFFTYNWNKIIYTNDGINYVLINEDAGVNFQDLSMFYYNGGYIIWNGSRTLLYSTDGVTFTTNTTALPLPYDGTYYISIANSNNMIVVGMRGIEAEGADSGKPYYSTDGITWVRATDHPTNYRSDSDAYTNPSSQVIYGNNEFVELTNSIKKVSPYDRIVKLYKSTDGISWVDTGFTEPYPLSPQGAEIYYLNNLYILLYATTNYLYTSTDAVTWQLVDNADLGSTSTLVNFYVNGKYFIAGDPYSNIGNVSYLTSTDGISWTSTTWRDALVDVPVGSYSIYIFEANNIIFAHVPKAANSSIRTWRYSTDLITWNEINTPSSYTYNEMYYVNGVYVDYYGGYGIAASSRIMYSTDLVTWTQGAFPVEADVFSIFSPDYPSTAQIQQGIPQSLNRHIAIQSKSIAPGETHEIKGGVTLSAGDEVRIKSTSTEIIANVYGAEIA